LAAGALPPILQSHVEPNLSGRELAAPLPVAHVCFELLRLSRSATDAVSASLHEVPHAHGRFVRKWQTDAPLHCVACHAGLHSLPKGRRRVQTRQMDATCQHYRPLSSPTSARPLIPSAIVGAGCAVARPGKAERGPKVVCRAKAGSASGFGAFRPASVHRRRRTRPDDPAMSLPPNDDRDEDST